MPRGGKRLGSGGKRMGAGAPLKNSNSLGNKGGAAPLKNSNSLGNKGGAAPLNNSNSLGNKGGAALGNTCSSSLDKKVSKLFEEGVRFDEQGDYIKALSKYREVFGLVPEHAEANYRVGRLLVIRRWQSDFVTSGPFLKIVEHYRIAERGGYEGAKLALCELLFNGDHDGEQGECRPHPDNWEEILEFFKIKAVKVQAKSDALPENGKLLADASLAHNLYAQVVMTCTDNAENNAAALVLAESVLRIAVRQNPRSLKATTDLATCLMKAKKAVDAILEFKLALIIQPSNSYAIDSLKNLEEWLIFDQQTPGWCWRDDKLIFRQTIQDQEHLKPYNYQTQVNFP
jgi:tetratricopeptide (TPR) repeat protein